MSKKDLDNESEDLTDENPDIYNVTKELFAAAKG